MPVYENKKGDPDYLMTKVMWCLVEGECESSHLGVCQKLFGVVTKKRLAAVGECFEMLKGMGLILGGEKGEHYVKRNPFPPEAEKDATL